jgi:TonB family protein
MGELFKKLSLVGLCVAALLPGIASADEDEEPLVLKPSSRWHVNYADDSCRMMRMFGEGDEESAFVIERYGPTDSFFMLVGGKPLKAARHVDTALRFGPDGYEFDRSTKEGEFGEHSPAVMASGMRLVATPDADEYQSYNERFDPEKEAQDTDLFEQEITPEQEAAISWLEIRRGRARPIRLELGSMGPPMEAMRQCIDELLTHWGIDLEAHREITRAVVPKANPARWVRSSDYPLNLVRKGAQGLVQFRLSVGADGVPTQCHIQASTRPEGFDKAVCNALMRRARFEPALDAEGRPIASYWRSAVSFEMP